MRRFFFYLLELSGFKIASYARRSEKISGNVLAGTVKEIFDAATKQMA